MILLLIDRRGTQKQKGHPRGGFFAIGRYNREDIIHETSRVSQKQCPGYCSKSRF